MNRTGLSLRHAFSNNNHIRLIIKRLSMIDDLAMGPRSLLLRLYTYMDTDQLAVLLRVRSTRPLSLKFRPACFTALPS